MPSFTRELAEIPVAACVPRSGNRDLSHDPALPELADSIRVIGLLNPIQVRELDDKTYEICAGVRRWSAHRLLEAETISAFVYRGASDTVADQVRFVENEHRRDPSALDTARGLRAIKNARGLTHAQLAAETGVQIDRVKRYLAVFAASDQILGALEQNHIPICTALSLMRYEKAKGEVATRPIIRKVLAGEMTGIDVDALRKRGARASKDAATRAPAPVAPTLRRAITRALKRDADATLAILRAVLAEQAPDASRSKRAAKGAAG